MLRFAPLALIAALMPLPVSADAHGSTDMVTYETVDSFDDASFALESAIIGQGLVIDNVSHVGEMLARTAEDLGAETKIFENAEVYNFCSAGLSRKVMEADIANIAFCPYGIFVYQAPGDDGSVIGYRTFPDGPMAEVQELLDTIAREAAGQ